MLPKLRTRLVRHSAGSRSAYPDADRHCTKKEGYKTGTTLTPSLPDYFFSLPNAEKRLNRRHSPGRVSNCH
jgi:hypothetical protein